MSLLADVLSKLNYQKEAGSDVPLGLKRIVSNFHKRDVMMKKKVLLISLLLMLMVLSGFGTLYFMELYIKPVTYKKRPLQIDDENRQLKQLVNKANVLPVVSSLPALAKDIDPKQEKVSSPAQARKTKREKPQRLAKQSRKEIAEDYTGKTIALAKAQTETIESPNNIKRETIPDSNVERDVYLYSAISYESKKDYSQALLNYKKALELDPQNYIIINNISSVLLHMGALDDAMQYAKNALTIKKDYIPSLINLGITCLRHNNIIEGEYFLSKALSLEASNKYAMLNIAILYESRKDYDTAYSYFYKLSEMGDIQGYLGIGRIAERQGNVSGAVGIYKEIISMEDNSLQIKKLASDRLLLLGQ